LATLVWPTSMPSLRSSPWIPVSVATGETERQWIAKRVDDHVDFCRKAAARAADGLVAPPLAIDEPLRVRLQNTVACWRCRICSRNDAIGNVAVLLAAVGFFR